MYKSIKNISIRTSSLFIKEGDMFDDTQAEKMINKHPVLKTVLIKKKLKND